jgi:hypothetical protein
VAKKYTSVLLWTYFKLLSGWRRDLGVELIIIFSHVFSTWNLRTEFLSISSPRRKETHSNSVHLHIFTHAGTVLINRAVNRIKLSLFIPLGEKLYDGERSHECMKVLTTYSAYVCHCLPRFSARGVEHSNHECGNPVRGLSTPLLIQWYRVVAWLKIDLFSFLQRPDQPINQTVWPCHVIRGGGWRIARLGKRSWKVSSTRSLQIQPFPHFPFFHYFSVENSSSSP